MLLLPRLHISPGRPMARTVSTARHISSAGRSRQLHETESGTGPVTTAFMLLVVCLC